MAWSRSEKIEPIVDNLRSQGYYIFAVEQADNSMSLPDFDPPKKIAIIVGREVEGIEPEVLTLCDGVLEIPMFGKKESFNVVQAAAMALYHCTFVSDN